MRRKTGILFCVLIFVMATAVVSAEWTFDKYHKPKDLNAELQTIARQNPKIAVIHTLGKSYGGRAVMVLEIGPEVGKKEKVFPAVFVAANMEGTVIISSEAALYLAKEIVKKPEVRKDRTWYVLPCGNPDAAASYFARPLKWDPRNGRPHNDDMDDRTDEDGVDDLDGNGIITQMRVKDPQGQWISIPGETRLMKKADRTKGEKGVYKLYTEGIDNDEDGFYNEDGPGGVNIGINFPQLFKFFTKNGGSWAGSETESFFLIKFIMEHREIGMTFTMGATNFCLVPPKGGRKGAVDLTKLKIPKRFAGFLNADPEKTYTIKEVIELVKPLAPEGMEINESLVASFLGLGAVVNPLPEDLKFYKDLSDKYKEFLEKSKLDGKRLDPAAAKDGSFELWSYYHLGLPSFSMDFWTLPEVKDEKKKEPEITPEKLEKMTSDEFIALGEEKIQKFLKDSGAPDQFKASQIIGALKGGMMTTKKMAEMIRQMPKPKGKEGADPKEKALLAFSDKQMKGKGFVVWKAFKHPMLGNVEIGGSVPFADNTPPEAMIHDLLKGQVPWVFEIASKMARIKINKTETKALGAGVYRIKVWVENTGYLPYPTAMGKRNNRILPVLLSLEGKGFSVIEGKKRSSIKSIDGYQTQTAEWIIRADKPIQLLIKVKTSIAWCDQKQVKLGETK
jgi:hypothetical protein